VLVSRLSEPPSIHLDYRSAPSVLLIPGLTRTHFSAIPRSFSKLPLSGSIDTVTSPPRHSVREDRSGDLDQITFPCSKGFRLGVSYSSPSII
jgi:hypothetical protein